MFQRAERTQLWLRMALMGSTKGGKSFTGLKILTYLCGDNRVAAIDTEHGRLRLYTPAPGTQPDPDKGTFRFDSVELDNYDPKIYIEAINEAVKMGYGGLLIDSLTHAWAGEGGVLDQKQKLDDRGGNSYTNWGKMTPIQNRLIETIMGAPIHIVCTMRSKMDYVMETSSTGKQVPKKVGLAPVQRNDVEYEFDILGMMESGSMRVIGSRCSDLPEGMEIKEPGLELAKTLNSWLGIGAELPLTKSEFVDIMKQRGFDAPSMKSLVDAHPELTGTYKWSQLLELA